MIRITKLARPEHCGDWHDKPLKWAVNGPSNEVQKFSTKKEAELYRTCRARYVTQNEAIKAFVRRS